MKMRKGFTLVELLIVIVIIGILASAMMLSSGSATDSAEASNIITDMRGLKTACTMLYADSMDYFNTSSPAKPAIEVLAKYMDNPSKLGTATTSPFSIEFGTGTYAGTWFVAFNFKKAAANRATAGVKEKLAGRAKSVGLYKSPSYAEDQIFTGATNEETIYMVAR